LEKIIWIIKKKFIFILLSALLLALVTGIYANCTKTSTYVAQISFYVYSNPDYLTDYSVNISSADFSQAKNLLDSYMQILKSRTFLEKVTEETGLSYSVSGLRSAISASAVQNTAVFNMNVFDADPLNAMTIANAIGDLAPAEITRIVKSGGIEVLDNAILPTTPYASTSVLKYILAGALGGGILAAGFFLLRGLLDTTIRRKYEIEDIFTIPILGDVPQINPSSKKEKIKMELDKGSPFALKEAYNNIRANLLFTGKGEKCPTYAVTSADINEGKTLNSINLALSYAKLGKNVLLIEADMRKGRIGTRLGIEFEAGLSQYLAGITDKVNIQKVGDSLSVILAGDIPPNPAELLAGDRWPELLQKSRQEFDIIFVDLPPLGVVSDGLSMAKEVTAYLLVIREGVTKFDREQMIVRQLENIGANICGFIYNGISIKSQDYNYRNYINAYES